MKLLAFLLAWAAISLAVGYLFGSAASLGGPDDSPRTLWVIEPPIGGQEKGSQ